jgi:hypothetical protein
MEQITEENKEAYPLVIFHTSYLPPISYFHQLVKYRIIYIDIFENYIKQTYRNRCYLYGANGKLSLNIPVIKTTGNHTKVRDLEIDYSQPWQRMHWRSIESAYNTSPFFLYYKDAFEPFYRKQTKFLIDFNSSILTMIAKLCKIQCEIKFTEKYAEPANTIIDLRNTFSSKIKSGQQLEFPHYTQVFESKYGFIPGLSILDLLFNEGKYCKEYLLKINL